MPENQEPENRRINMGDGNYNELIDGDYVQGTLYKSYINIYPNRPAKEQTLLIKVKCEIEELLTRSLFEIGSINLQKQLQPRLVKPVRSVKIKVGSKPIEPLPDNTKILEVFTRKDIAGRLLILGAPGSGKTTTLLELAKDLIHRAESSVSEPIPVLVNLSSWKDNNQTFIEWLLREIASSSKYGVSINLAKEWLENYRLVPLLDGFDELASVHQESCFLKINNFLNKEYPFLPLVVCSRSEEYENFTKAYKTILQLNGAVCLQSLTNTQIHDYLKTLNNTKLWNIINDNQEILTLVKTPLLLTIVLLSYQEMVVEEWLKLTSSKERLDYLLDAYVQRMLNRDIENKIYIRQKPPTAKEIKQQLIWQAQQLERESQTEFLIENIQQLWLPSINQRRIYILSVKLVDILIVGLLFAIIGLSSGVIISGLILGLFGLYIGLIYVLDIYTNIRLIVLTFVSSIFFYFIAGFLLNLLFNQLFIEIMIALSYCLMISSFLLLCMFLYIFSISLFLAVFIKWLIPLKIKILSRNLRNFFFYLINILLSVLLLKTEEVKPVETLKRFRIYMIRGGILGFLICCSNGVIVSVGGLIFCIAIGMLIGVIVCELTDYHIEIKTFPNQGIRKSLVNAIISGVIGVLTSVLIIGLYSGLSLALFNGLIIGIISFLIGGGNACIKHFILRLILYFNGYIPWNYARFLDYCTERLFLQRVGGRYRFIHKMLQDHFAKMDLE